MNIYRKLPPATPDDLHTPEVGEWGRQKYLRLWIYADIFSLGMKKRYEHRVYIDLFSGAGMARIRETGELVLGSPLLALSVAEPFTRYIFCDRDERNIEALRARVERDFPWADARFVNAPVEGAVDEIISHLPRGTSNLNFCFADPFDLEFDFRIVERLARGRKMDFLTLLAAQMDGQRNVANYLSPSNTRIERLLNEPDWRAKWDAARKAGAKFQWFLVEEYYNAMERIGYTRPKPSDAHKVETESRSVPLYYLLFFSRHVLGYKFWREALKYSDSQRSLSLFD